MAGRPTKLTRETEADLTLLLARGVPVKLAASATDVSPRSVRRWLHEGLRERVAEVKAIERDVEPGRSLACTTTATDEARLVVLLLRANDWRASPGGWSAATPSAGALRGCRRDRRRRANRRP